MADDQSEDAKLPDFILKKANEPSTETKLSDDIVLTASLNHQLPTSLSHVTHLTDFREKLTSQVNLFSAISSVNISTPENKAIDVVAKTQNELSVFNFEHTDTSSAVKRTRGRPRKDCLRTPKHYLPQSIASKVIKGRGRPKRDDILHHKMPTSFGSFPGRPRYRGRKFHHFFMTHTPHRPLPISRPLDVYEDIDSDLKPTGDTAEKMVVSSSAIPDNEVRINKFCSLCNLSDTSLLGQGKLTNFKPTAGFNCFESMEQKAQEVQKTVEISSDSGNELKLFFKKHKSLEHGEHMRLQKSKSLLNFHEKSSLTTDLIQELELTGFKSTPESSSIFQTSGELYAHFNCAAWSEGVTKTFEKKLSNVDKAVVIAAFRKCSRCERFGASVKCCVSDCTKIYHYPCAIVSGALQAILFHQMGSNKVQWYPVL